MGFWHTGYMEFHESSGFEAVFEPKPTIYNCSHCHYTTFSLEDLRRHRFETHPYNRPILYIKDKELGSTPFRVTYRLSPEDVKTERCSSVLINGENLSILELGNRLSQINNDTITLELKSERVSATFKVRFEIAEEADLKAVDKNLIDVARGRRLDMRSIEQFIYSCKPYQTAMGYCDGICEYFYGVLAKERSDESTLPYEAYLEKFNRAIDELKDFDRPIARTIGALIEFHFNHFSEAKNLADPFRVGIAAEYFYNCLTSKQNYSESPNITKDDDLEKLLTDIDTERFIQWAVLSPAELITHKCEIVSLLNKQISDFDKAKAHILLGQLAIHNGDTDDALLYAKEFRNSPTMSAWAEQIIETCKNLG